jgi:hypothetical protein
MFPLPSKISDNGVHDGYTSLNLVTRGVVLPAGEPFTEWLTSDPVYGPVVTAAVGKLSPGGYILPHRDKGPWRHRTHVPLEPAGWYWDETQGAVQLDVRGVEYPVYHHLPHAVWNDTDRMRVHLIIDRGDIHSDGPFIAYPTSVCPELAAFLTA